MFDRRGLLLRMQNITMCWRSYETKESSFNLLVLSLWCGGHVINDNKRRATWWGENIKKSLAFFVLLCVSRHHNDRVLLQNEHHYPDTFVHSVLECYLNVTAAFLHQLTVMSTEYLPVIQIKRWVDISTVCFGRCKFILVWKH